MKKTKLNRIFAAVFCIVLIFSMTACTGGETETSSKAEISPTPAPEVSSQSEPTPAPEEEGAVPTPAPEGEDGAIHSGLLPMPETGSQAFINEFMTNPIDVEYELAMNDAASMTAMVDACNVASESWKEQIDAVYMLILESADEATAAEVKAAQEDWLDQQNNQLQEIRNAVAEDDAMAAMTVAENIMLYYRSRAIDLYAVLYEIDGQLVFG